MGKLLQKLKGGKKSRHKNDVEELEWIDFDEDEEYEDDEYAEDEEEYEDDEYAEEEYEYEDDEYAEDEEEYEDDEYYEDDYYEDYDEDDEDAPESGIKRVLYKITNLSTVDYVVALTGVAVLVLAIVTGTLYMGARSNKAQIEAFAEVGEGMESISIIGQSGLLAIADAQASRMAAADIEEEDGEGGESDEEDENGKKEVLLNLTSIQKDLKIKFVEKKSGKLVSGIAFEVEIQKPSGDTYSKKDEDKDGIIYEKDIAPGKYKVKITSPASDDEYGISGETIAITVRDSIEYKKVDVSDEVKTESQVNAAAEIIWFV